MKKLINSKIVWIVLIGILAILLSFLIINSNINKNNENNNLTYSFVLKGENTINLTVGSKYNELGYIAVDSNNKDISSYVKKTGEVDTSKPGTYKITYKLEIENYKKELTRKVIVKDKLSYSFELKGENTINLMVGSKYEDPG